MELDPQFDDEVLLIDQTQDDEVVSQTTRLQELGSKLIYYANRLTAIGAATAALLGAGPLTDKGFAADNPQYGENVTLVSLTNTKAEFNFQATISSSLPETDCTEIMDFPLGYYMGEACSNDIEYKLWESNPSGFDYAVLVADGVYKCGWVKAGVLDTRIADGSTKGAAYCETAARSLSRIPYKIIYKLNCQPGTCTDGRQDPLSADCNDKMFRNFASDTQSVFNIFPYNNSGFSDYLGQQTGYIYYRGTIVYGSAFGEAIDVRNNTTGWAFMFADCDPQVQ